MFGVFLGLVFVKQRHDLAHHHVHGIVAHLLRDGNQFDAVLRQLPHIELKFKVIAEEALEAVDHHHVEGCRLGDARLDHLLKLGPPVVGGGCPRLNISLDQFVPALAAIRLALLALIGNRNVMLGLPRRGHAQVKGGAEWDGPLRRVHGPDFPQIVGLQDFSTRAEQVVENITEPGLEHIHFTRTHRDACWPVISDGPSRKVVPGRPPDPLAGHVQIIEQVYRLLRTGFDRGTAHGKSIALRPDSANSQYSS